MREVPAAFGSQNSWINVDVESDLDFLQAIDPYLLWVQLCNSSSLVNESEGYLPAAFELKSRNRGQAVVNLVSELVDGIPELRISPAWREALRGNETLFFTALVHPSSLKKLFAAGNNIFRRVKFGLVGGQYQQNYPTPRSLSVETSESTVSPPSATRSSDPIVGIIDFGCSFAHPAFCFAEEGSAKWVTRVTHLWEQEHLAWLSKEMNSAGNWTSCSAFGYGREAASDGLNRFIQQAAEETHSDGKYMENGFAALERRCYELASMDNMLEGDRPAAHGTQVMDVACGKFFRHPEQERQDKIPTKSAVGDLASKTEIMFVQLPKPVVKDLSCGWLTVYVLDAVKYLVDRSEGRPLVINLSFGTYAGSHDGLSLLEKALDSFVSEQVKIVIAAGNMVGQHIHARAYIPAGGSASLNWCVPVGDATQNFLELWYSVETESRDLKDAELPVFRLSHPDVSGEAVVEGCGARFYGSRVDSQLVPLACIIHVPGTLAGGKHGMALISLGPTMTPSLALEQWPVRSPHGRWQLHITNQSSKMLTCHAWVERDEPGLIPVTLAPQSVLETGENNGDFQLDNFYTLSGQCGGSKVIVVGAYRLGEINIQPALDTAFGPNRLPGGRVGPDLLAPGSQSIRGIDCGFPVAGSLSEATVYGCGTSLAAPWVVRQLVNSRLSLLDFAKGPSFGSTIGYGYLAPDGKFRQIETV